MRVLKPIPQWHMYSNKATPSNSTTSWAKHIQTLAKNAALREWSYVCLLIFLPSTSTEYYHVLDTGKQWGLNILITLLGLKISYIKHINYHSTQHIAAFPVDFGFLTYSQGFKNHLLFNKEL